jgi:hypothetical protein
MAGAGGYISDTRFDTRYSQGYFEMKGVIGSAWNTFWLMGAGQYVCPANPGAEWDIAENIFGRGDIKSSTHQGGDACEVTNEQVVSIDTSHSHLWGVQISQSRGTTFYVDGVAQYTVPVAQLQPNPNGNVILITAGNPANVGNNSIPMQIEWVRVYNGNPR